MKKVIKIFKCKQKTTGVLDIIVIADKKIFNFTLGSLCYIPGNVLEIVPSFPVFRTVPKPG